VFDNVDVNVPLELYFAENVYEYIEKKMEGNVLERLSMFNALARGSLYKERDNKFEEVYE
jgi:hypothetical protein